MTCSRCFAIAAAGVLFSVTAPEVGAQDPCARLASEVQSLRIHHDGKLRRITVSNVGCRIEAQIRGELRFTPDFRGIAAVEEGGRFTIEESADGDVRRLVAEGGAGALVLDYRVNGMRRDVDAAAESWLADRLLVLFRSSALAADERARWILEREGLDGLIAETSRVNSSSGRSHYLSAALAHPGMTTAQLAVLLRDALPTSSSRQAEILRVVVARRPMEPALVDAILAAMRQVSSSSTQREILTLAVAADAPRPLVLGALRESERVSSTAARRDILVAAAEAHAFDDAMLGAYLASVGGMSSSSATRDALIALIARDELSSAQRARVIRAAGSISSSTAQADVLVAAAQRWRLEGEARDAYVAVARAVSSSSQRARALEALVARQ